MMRYSARRTGTLRGGYTWSLLVLLGSMLASLQGTGAARAAGLAVVAATDLPPACGTAGGLDVQSKQRTLHGIQGYTYVCVLGGGRLLAAAALTLRTGLLYVDAGSSIVADGLPGGPKTVDCDRTGTGRPDGAPGSPVTILANRATVLGRITANGGAGYDGTESPCTKRDGGNGGNGGQITLEATGLTLQGSMAATGGSGGNGNTPDPLADQFFKRGGRAGSGGNGGQITLLLAYPNPARFASLLHVAGGAAGTPGDDPCVAAGTCKMHGYPGRHGRPGRIVIGTLSTAQVAALPSPTQ